VARWEREARKKAERIAEFQRQVEDGEVVVRQATPDELARLDAQIKRRRPFASALVVEDAR